MVKNDLPSITNVDTRYITKILSEQGALKAAIVNFSRSMAKILAPEIRVNTLSPTRTGSPVGEEEERSGKVVDAILVGRWGRPEDQANAALFLVDPENGFITGSELAVDGGSLV